MKATFFPFDVEVACNRKLDPFKSKSANPSTSLREDNGRTIDDRTAKNNDGLDNGQNA